MVKLNKIYTRTGDKGDTGLGGGIGLARLHTTGDADAALGRIQNDLFDLGADLCTPEMEGEKLDAALRIADAQVDRLEREIDALNARLSPLNSFILPGGNPAAAHLHLARTVSRRAERLMVELADSEKVNPAALRYINRLSDFLFVIGRHVNNDGNTDVLWKPGQNR